MRLVDRVLYALGRAFVFDPLVNTLGFSRIRLAYTAGEALGPDIFAFYRSLGVNLKQLYGQTEAAVFVTMHPDEEVRPDTVGTPAPGVEVRIADDGEVVYRSPGVFREYHRNAQATSETKTPDGWVRTGDAGYFDEAGHLKIIDRVKDVGKLSDGTVFAPKYIENKLKFFPEIKEAVAFGNERDSTVAFINIDLQAVGNWAQRQGVAYVSCQDLVGKVDVHDLIQGHIERVNRELASDSHLGGSQIGRFLILHKELDADDAETYAHAQGAAALHRRTVRRPGGSALFGPGTLRSRGPGDLRGRQHGDPAWRPEDPRCGLLQPASPEGTAVAGRAMEAQAVTDKTIRGRVVFHDALDVMEVDFSSLHFTSHGEIDNFYDEVDRQLAASGRRWYFLVNYAGCVIVPGVWTRFAARGKQSNIAFSLGTVRVSATEETRETIRERAREERFRANLFDTRDQALVALMDRKRRRRDPGCTRRPPHRFSVSRTSTCALAAYALCKGSPSRSTAARSSRSSARTGPARPPC